MPSRISATLDGDDIPAQKAKTLSVPPKKIPPIPPLKTHTPVTTNLQGEALWLDFVNTAKPHFIKTWPRQMLSK